MPSSHMTVIIAFTLYILMQKNMNIFVKIGMIIFCVLQGIARVNLHYHTYEQVFGGVLFGSVFCYLFFKAFDSVWKRIRNYVPRWANIKEDLYL